jgi:ArsR family transcriptional regulator, cadmium/lead-responsive transcriptional repressor
VTAEPDDRLWSAIADPSRRRVLDLLVTEVEASASWLAGRVPFTRQAVSKHLVALEEAGLVTRRKQGREVLYRVDAARLDQAARAMADVARAWDGRLITIKRLAESTHARAKQKTAKPKAATQNTAKPNAAKPNAAKPNAAKPNAAKPNAAKPNAGGP